MSHYDTNDETDVAQGIFDALTRDASAKGEKGYEWLGWQIDDPVLGEFEVTVPEGKRYRVTVEPIED